MRFQFINNFFIKSKIANIDFFLILRLLFLFILLFLFLCAFFKDFFIWSFIFVTKIFVLFLTLLLICLSKIFSEDFALPHSLLYWSFLLYLLFIQFFNICFSIYALNFYWHFSRLLLDWNLLLNFWSLNFQLFLWLIVFYLWLTIIWQAHV